jgi:hypothetical protein
MDCLAFQRTHVWSKDVLGSKNGQFGNSLLSTIFMNALVLGRPSFFSISLANTAFK